MLPGRQRAFALALAVMLAFSIGVYYGRERLYDTVLRLSSPAGRASFQQDGQGSLVVPAAWSSDTSAAPIKRANGAFVILVRNEDLGSILESIQQVELHFNRRCHYPYVFLDDKKFTPHFIETTSAAVSGNATYGLVPKEQWEEPSWIDKKKAADARKKMEADGVIYGGSETYRRMCRYQSGFFFRHPLLDSYDYYWRIEPSVKYFCDIPDDPFVFMEKNKKEYGFTISIKEYEATIPTLWKTTKDFMKEHPEHIAKDNSLDWVSNDQGETYNLCHFWSNFEIGSLNFLRSKAYTDYFDYLDKTGGFSYERWGDAPVHSIAAALFLPTEKVHFFDKIGYYHVPFQHCPVTAREQGCFCDVKQSFEFHWYSCTSQWHDLQKKKGLE